MFGRKAKTPAQTTDHAAAELLDRVKDSETVAKAQAKGAELAELARTKVKDAHLDERAAELAELARTKVKDAHLDERAAELAERARTTIRESETAQRAAERARIAGDQTLERLGAWLTETGAAEKLGMQPMRKRRWPGWLALAVGAGAGVGYVVAKLTERQETMESLDDFAASAERLATTPPPTTATTEPSTAAPVTPPTPTETAAASAQPTTVNGGLDLADRIRSRLDADPRTAELKGLAINVVETTVFVRGSVPEGTDEGTIREVISGVPGVTDVDLQVTTSA
jgi:hypothetical protein